MLLALIGLACSGKSSVAEYLVEKHGFTLITLNQDFSGALRFATPDDMLQHVTAHWRTNYVTLALDTSELIGLFEKRPFFLLVGIEAPLLQRWERAKARCNAESNAHVPLDLASFVAQDDRILYGTTDTLNVDSDVSNNDASNASDVSHVSLLQQHGALVSASVPSSDTALTTLLSRSQLRIANTFSSLSQLHAHLDILALPSTHRLRPTWDTYFVSLCSLASLRSNCMKRRVGAVIVRKNRVLSTGYNGTPRGLTNCNEGGCARCNESAPCGSNLDECLCLHAEENALLELGRDRGGAEGTILYCNTYVLRLIQMPMLEVRRQDCTDRRDGGGVSARVQYGWSQCADFRRSRCRVPQIPATLLVACGSFVVKYWSGTFWRTVVEKRTKHSAGDNRANEPCIVGHHHKHQKASNGYLYTIQKRAYCVQPRGCLHRAWSGEHTTYRMRSARGVALAVCFVDSESSFSPRSSAASLATRSE